jgi:hypothetical protein
MKRPVPAVLAGALGVLPALLLLGCSSRSSQRGWLLMHPPVVEQRERYQVSSRASMQFWDQAGAFDTASACEEERRVRTSGSSGAEQASASPPDGSRASAHAHAWAQARCVPSNAVYPARGAGERGYGLGSPGQSPPEP